MVHLTKNAPPTMKLSGAWSLNRSGSHGWSARKGCGLGCQKFTSSTSGSAARNRNHSLSVTATYARIAG